MKVLDCETTDSTYASLEQILGVGRSQLESVFENVDVESFYRDNRYYPQPPESLVFSEVSKVITLPGDYDRTCWFHLTRTAPSNNFQQGILPLGQRLDAIWNFLYSLAKKSVSPEEWDEFRREMGSHHHAGLYEMKASDSMHWGPYALLSRDHAFKPEEIGNHDYLGAPEIVEDICICFSERYEFDLLGAFMKKTRPCIVKFFDGSRSDCVSTAVYHLYNAHRGNGCSGQCNTCYDGEGVSVTPERIMKVEFPKYKKHRRKLMSADASSWQEHVKHLWDEV
ncbi:MAG: hypothetical protein WBP93_22005 [Pyrinomonadaceae bacterium]